MATSKASGVPAKKEEEFNEFYTEVKEIEKRDSVLTPSQQIERLLRPGSSYFNLNPFEVLQVEPEFSLEDIKKKYKRLSILVHPDKNQNDPERAQQAFEIINKAWKTLESDDTRAKCMDIVEEAKARTDMMIAEKKKKLKKEGKSTQVKEDSPPERQRAVYITTMKLFADLERKKRSLEKRDMEERKRKREQEIEAEEKASLEKEWQTNFEKSRENRVNSWKNFQAGGSSSSSSVGVSSSDTVTPTPVATNFVVKHKSKKMKVFKPPKHKAETR